jgi:hypothetical protein
MWSWLRAGLSIEAELRKHSPLGEIGIGGTSNRPWTRGETRDGWSELVRLLRGRGHGWQRFFDWSKTRASGQVPINSFELKILICLFEGLLIVFWIERTSQKWTSFMRICGESTSTFRLEVMLRVIRTNWNQRTLYSDGVPRFGWCILREPKRDLQCHLTRLCPNWKSFLLPLKNVLDDSSDNLPENSQLETSVWDGR